MKNTIQIVDVDEASVGLAKVINKTPLQYSARLSDLYKAKVYLKREDLQPVRSYKIRGSYNLMSKINATQTASEVVTASAGNHAQGVAFSASKLKMKATIFMPITTPLQKVNRVRHFGGKWANIKMVGSSFDESCKAALDYAKENKSVFVHPFNDPVVITGQATVGKEIIEELGGDVDAIVCPVGGGGLIFGVGSYAEAVQPKTKIISVEPVGADAFHRSLKANKLVTIKNIDTFVDGVAVETMGDLTFEIAKKLTSDSLVIPVGKICSTMIDLYQNEGIVAEPAGALSVSALDDLASSIKGKTVVCIISGGNNDILRYPEILEKSLIYEGLKHYFLIEFAQKPGQLRAFLDHALGPNDDVVRIEYVQKTGKEKGTTLVGIQLAYKKDYSQLITNLDKIGLSYTVLSEHNQLYDYLI